MVDMWFSSLGAQFSQCQCGEGNSWFDWCVVRSQLCHRHSLPWLRVCVGGCVCAGAPLRICVCLFSGLRTFYNRDTW